MEESIPEARCVLYRCAGPMKGTTAPHQECVLKNPGIQVMHSSPHSLLYQSLYADVTSTLNDTIKWGTLLQSQLSQDCLFQSYVGEEMASEYRLDGSTVERLSKVKICQELKSWERKWGWKSVNDSLSGSHLASKKMMYLTWQRGHLNRLNGKL